MTPLPAAHLRRLVLQQAYRARVGHIGSALSIVDVMAALYGAVLRAGSPRDPDRDRFILSKGHGALALYAALVAKGWLTDAALDRYCTDGGDLGVHPDHRVPGIDFSTGSLGHGLSIGAGAALAARLAGSPRRVFVLLSDAECNAGASRIVGQRCLARSRVPPLSARAKRHASAKCVGSCMLVGRYSDSGQNVATTTAAAADGPPAVPRAQAKIARVTRARFTRKAEYGRHPNARAMAPWKTAKTGPCGPNLENDARAGSSWMVM